MSGSICFWVRTQRALLALGLLLGAAFSLDAFAGNMSVSVGNASVTVSGPNSTVLNFPITRMGDLSYDAYLGYQLTDGSALAGKDYTVAPGTLKLPAGVSTLNLPVTISGSQIQFSDKNFTLQLLGAGIRGASIATNSAQAPFYITLNHGVFAVVAADVTGDGKSDLLATNSSNNTVNIWRNSTLPGAHTTGYVPINSFAVGNLPQGLTVADLNGDGMPDVIVANKGDNTVSVLLNTGSSFTTQEVFAAGSSPQSVAAADINGDGRPDLIIGDMSGGTFTVLMNVTPQGASTVSFAAPQTFTAGTGVTGYAVTTADVNQDGRPDVIVASNTNTIDILLNTTQQGSATATFASAQSFAVGNGAGAVRVADINGDGKPDLVTANFSDSTISVLLNNTAPGATTTSYVPQQVFSNTFGTSKPFQSYDVAIGDVDGDGIPDLVVTQCNSSVTTGAWIGGWLNKTVPGSMTAVFVASVLDLNVSSYPTSPIVSIAAADVNLDGTSDVITLSQSQISVLPTAGVPGGGAASFAASENFTTGTGPREVTVADLNNDGKPDLVTANYSSSTVSVLLNTTAAGAMTATYSANKQFAVSANPTSVAAGEMTDDTKVDLAVTGGGIQILRNTTTNGAITPFFNAAVNVSTQGAPSFLVTAGATNTENTDLVTTILNTKFVPSHNQLTYFRNTTTAGLGGLNISFAPTVIADVGYSVDIAVEADINGDGVPDQVFLINGSADVLIDSGIMSVYSFGSGTATGLAVADVNGDGKPDLILVSPIAGSTTSSTVTVFLNTTVAGSNTPTFSGPQSLSAPYLGSSNIMATAVDVDGDGRLDLILSDSGDTKLTVLMNDTTPESAVVKFVPAGSISTGETAGVYDVKALDVNADRKIDLVVGGNQNFIDILLNTVNNTGLLTSYSATGTIHYNIVPPVINITGPSGSTFLSPSQVLVGSLSNAGYLYINGAYVPLNPDHSFNYSVTLNVVGSNIFTLVAMDFQGNIATVTRTLTLLPTTTFTLQMGAAAAGETITVTDIATGATVTGTVNPDGSFTTTLQGVSSDNISIVLTDGSGNQSPPVYQHGDDAPLSLVVTSPSNGASIAADTVNVVGTYSGAQSMGITVNGRPAVLVNGQFAANGVKLTPGSNTLTVVATTSGGLSTTQVLTVTSTDTPKLVLTASPTGGMAPLSVDFQFQFEGTGTLQNLKMSYLGSGTNDVDTSDFSTPLTYTYLIPGIYPATVTLTDTNGNQYQAVVQVVVQDSNQLDAMFKRMWSDMTTALAQGNKIAAMNGLDYDAQQSYGPVFDQLMPYMTSIVGAFSTPLQSNISGTTAEYAIVRVEDGQQYVYFIYFTLDSDGVWRIDSM